MGRGQPLLPTPPLSQRRCLRRPPNYFVYTYVEEDGHALGQLQGRAELFRGVVGGWRGLPGILHPQRSWCLRAETDWEGCSRSDLVLSHLLAPRAAPPGSDASGCSLGARLPPLSADSPPSPASRLQHASFRRPLPVADCTSLGIRLIPAVSNNVTPLASEHSLAWASP